MVLGTMLLQFEHLINASCIFFLGLRLTVSMVMYSWAISTRFLFTKIGFKVNAGFWSLEISESGFSLLLSI